MTFALQILGCDYRIASGNDLVARSLKDLTSGFGIDDRGNGKTLSISPDLCVSGLSEIPKHYDSVEETLVGVEHDLYRDAVLNCGDIALHAAVVRANARTILIAGASGAGKTTLTLGLLRKGWSLLSDEIAPLSVKGTVRPFPRCPGASAATLRLLAWPTRETAHVYLNNTFCLLPSALNVAAEDAYPVDAVVFAERSALTSLVPMDSAQAVTRLLQMVKGQANPKTAFETAGRIAETATFHSLKNGDLSQTIDLVETLK